MGWFGNNRARIGMKKTIEIRFGDMPSFYLYAGEDNSISLAEAHLKVFGWVKEKNIFPVLSNDVIADRIAREISEGKYPVGDLGKAVQEFHAIRSLWKNLTGYLMPIRDVVVANFIIVRSNDFWSLMSMRFGLFLDGKCLSRGYVVNVHDLLEDITLK